MSEGKYYCLRNLETTPPWLNIFVITDTVHSTTEINEDVQEKKLLRANWLILVSKIFKDHELVGRGCFDMVQHNSILSTRPGFRLRSGAKIWF